MSTHIYNRKRITLDVACRMLKLYKGLLKLGVPQKVARGEACYQIEAAQQAASHEFKVRDPRGDGRCTAYKDPKYVKGFETVFLAAVGVVPKGQDLKGSNSEATIIRLFSEHRPDTYAKMMKAKANYKNMTGLNVKKLPQWLIKNRYQEWLKIRRGKDLFVKGWGRFDITKAVLFGRVDSQRGPSRGRDNLTPLTLQAIGYDSPQSWIFERILKDKPHIVAWIARFKDWFWPADKDLGLQRRARWDEVVRHADSDYQHISIEDRNPESFFQEVDRIQAVYEDEVDGETCDYTHLQGIPEMTTEVGIIKPIRSTQELIQAGKDLHQCAKSYNRRILEGLSTLMVCCREDGKPIAMAEIEHDSEGMILGQVSGICNAPVSEEIEKAFHNCLTNMLRNSASTL